MEKITESFPIYPLQGKVLEDIFPSFKKSGGNRSDLPKISVPVGGNINFMIRIKYLRHHPKLIYQLPSGLSIYESMFKNTDGTRAVIGGPHEVFIKMEEQFKSNISNTFNSKSFLSQQFELYRKAYHINPDSEHIKTNKYPDIDNDNLQNQNTSVVIKEEPVKNSQTESLVIRSEKAFNLAENAASEITFCCVNCRNCKNFKDNDKTGLISIKEEIEQDHINKSAKVDIKNRFCTTKLPVIHNPSQTSSQQDQSYSNIQPTTKTVKQKLKGHKRCNSFRSKITCISLCMLLERFTNRVTKMLKENPVQNYIPWRAVWNENSPTPCRIVLDASNITDSGYSP